MLRRAMLILLAGATLHCPAAGTDYNGPATDDAGSDPTLKCISGSWWTHGDDGDNDMHPGRACIHCHSAWHRGPTFSVAGTVFHAFDEGDDCNGLPGDFSPDSNRAAIEVTDANNHTFLIYANRVGNFYTTFPLRYPLHNIQVRFPDGTIQQMFDPAPNGGCNSCHTRVGTNSATGLAPGRIAPPPM